MNEINSNRYSRIPNGIAELLSTMLMVCIGLGRMGCHIVRQLALHGLGTKKPGGFLLIDGDFVQRHNFIGTPFTLRHEGKFKGDAMREILSEINPVINAASWNTMLKPSDVMKIVGIAQHAHLLGLFADDFPLNQRLAEACYPYCPILSASFGPNVDYVEIAYSIPNATPPLTRILHHREQQRERIDGAQALGTDIEYAANFAAGIAMALLCRDSPVSRHFPEIDQRCPLIYMGNKRIWLFQDMPPEQLRSIVKIECGK